MPLPAAAAYYKVSFVFTKLFRRLVPVRSGFRVEQCEIEAHAPLGAMARGIGVIFSADLDADRLFPNRPSLLTNPGAQRSGRCGLSAVGGQTVPNRRFFDASCFCALSAHFDELERAEEKRIAVAQ